jgi:cephalosporin-C deacetylase
MRMILPRILFVSACCSLAAGAVAQAAPEITITPLHASATYAVGEKVGWTVALPDGAAPLDPLPYTIKRNDAVEVKSGTVQFVGSRATIETTADEPAMLTLRVICPAGAKPLVAGAAVAPTQLRPVAPRPADFDAFWAAKIKALDAVPIGAVVTPGESDRPGVEYATVKLNNIGGAHVYGQIAKPAREGKFPAVLVMQYASPPYPLEKKWVTERATEGWLALNVEPHDVPGNMPKEFYAALPQLIKRYESVYNDDRDRNYFLRMYLGDYRAADYLASRPDWDGTTLVFTGGSMGGQQSLCLAGLYPRVTHVVVMEPAGCDANAALHGRAVSYPNWDASNPKVMETALYFDPVNFAPNIRATCLVGVGYVDEIARPAGIWTAFNLIRGPKELVPLIDCPHNNTSTKEQEQPYNTRAKEWLATLARGEPAHVR